MPAVRATEKGRIFLSPESNHLERAPKKQAPTFDLLAHCDSPRGTPSGVVPDNHLTDSNQNKLFRGADGKPANLVAMLEQKETATPQPKPATPQSPVVTAVATTSVGSSGQIAMLMALNASRASEGKAALTLDPILSQLAQAHSDEMKSQGKMFHNSLNNILAAGFQGAAQNVTGTGFTAETANKAFFDEKFNPGGEQGHYNNMMGDYTKVGIGVSTDGRWTIGFGK